MALFPIFLKLEGRKILIVGGGKIAEDKIGSVLRTAADLTVVSPQITDGIREWARLGRLKYIAGAYEIGMVRGHFLVIA